MHWACASCATTTAAAKARAPTACWAMAGCTVSLDNLSDAQKILDGFRNGSATIIGKTKNGFPIIRYNKVTGFNNNSGAGFINQPTNVFIIKGTKSPSIVPTNPNI